MHFNLVNRKQKKMFLKNENADFPMEENVPRMHNVKMDNPHPSMHPPGVGGVVSSPVPGSSDGSGSESSPGLPGARAEPQPDGEGPRRPGPSRRQARWLLPAIRCGEWRQELTKGTRTDRRLHENMFLSMHESGWYFKNKMNDLTSKNFKLIGAHAPYTSLTTRCHLSLFCSAGLRDQKTCLSPMKQSGAELYSVGGAVMDTLVCVCLDLKVCLTAGLWNDSPVNDITRTSVLALYGPAGCAVVSFFCCL